MTKVMLRADENGSLFFDCLNHAGSPPPEDPLDIMNTEHYTDPYDIVRKVRL